jgi:hypothetical protein
VPTTVVHCMKSGFDVYIGRPKISKENEHFGNPFGTNGSVSIKVASREEAIASFKDWLSGTKYTDLEQERRKWILENLHTLKDKRLGCWCKPLGCHGDVYLELLNTTP